MNDAEQKHLIEIQHHGGSGDRRCKLNAPNQMPQVSDLLRCNQTADFILSPWQLVVGDLKSLRSMVTCKVCFKMLYEPYTLSCGHTFCYSVGGSDLMLRGSC